MLLKQRDPPNGSLQAYCLGCAADLHMHWELCLVHTFSIASKFVMKEMVLWCRVVLAVLRWVCSRLWEHVSRTGLQTVSNDRCVPFSRRPTIMARGHIWIYGYMDIWIYGYVLRCVLRYAYVTVINYNRLYRHIWWHIISLLSLARFLSVLFVCLSRKLAQ